MINEHEHILKLETKGNVCCSNSTTAQCPCKSVPNLRLSSFTAAEHGVISDDHEWSNRRKKKKQLLLDSGGYTPLFLAAQHGHLSSTIKLLQHGWDVNGKESTCGATPLHRASYSGAIATMQVLLVVGGKRGNDSSDNNNHNNHTLLLLAKDCSFGDGMTPLHKAVSGGRYLAIQLLLEHLKLKQMTQVALTTQDSSLRTPLQLAREMQINGDYGSTRRWDVVSGDTADWDKCVILLEAAEKQQSSTPIVEPIVTSFMNCFDDKVDNDSQLLLVKGQEKNFREALTKKANKILIFVTKPKKDNEQENHEPVTSESNTRNLNNDSKNDIDHVNQPNEMRKGNETKRVGHTCQLCRENVVVLLRNRRGQLVCRACKTRKRY